MEPMAVDAPVKPLGDVANPMAHAVDLRNLGVPDGPDDVTAEWLTETLRRAGSPAATRVMGFDVEPLAAGRGFVARTVRFRLRFDEAPRGAPASLIAKFAPADPDLRATLNGGRFF